jgi:fukutin
LKFFVPSNIDKFIFDYKNSKFLECNQLLVKQNYNHKYVQNETINKIISPVIEHITQTLEGLEKHYWLAGGTLLGWYRDCGVIPHTQDVDIAILRSEYENSIKKHFLTNKIIKIYSTLGKVQNTINSKIKLFFF